WIARNSPASTPITPKAISHPAPGVPRLRMPSITASTPSTIQHTPSQMTPTSRALSGQTSTRMPKTTARLPRSNETYQSSRPNRPRIVSPVGVTISPLLCNVEAPYASDEASQLQDRAVGNWFRRSCASALSCPVPGDRVQQVAHHADQPHGGRQRLVVDVVPRVQHRVATPVGHPEHLRGHQHHPADPQGHPHRRTQLDGHPRNDHGPHPLGPGGTESARHLQGTLVDASPPRRGAEHDRPGGS